MTPKAMIRMVSIIQLILLPLLSSDLDAEHVVDTRLAHSPSFTFFTLFLENFCFENFGFNYSTDPGCLLSTAIWMQSTRSNEVDTAHSWSILINKWPHNQRNWVFETKERYMRL